MWDWNGFKFKWRKWFQFGIQLVWKSLALRTNWLASRSIWDSIDVRFKRFEIQWIWNSKDETWKLKTKLFCEISFKNDQKWRLQAQKRSSSVKLPSKVIIGFEACFLQKLKLWSSKTNRFCQTSFNNQALKLKNEVFLRDLLQKWSFENPKTKLFCEASFKHENLKLKNKAFLRDFLQKWNSETQKRNFSARLFSKMTCRPDSWLQYVLAIFQWMLQKDCACHEKVEPRHTNSCNCHARWSMLCNISAGRNLQPFHRFSVWSFKHRHYKARDPCACHAKSTLSDPLQIHHPCQRFCTPHELRHLLRILQLAKILAPAMRNAVWTFKNAPRPSVLNGVDFEIALAPQRGANVAKLNFQKRSEHAAWCLFLRKSFSRDSVVQILRRSTSKNAPNLPVFNNFDFQTALAPQSGANVAKLNLKKRSEHAAWCLFFAEIALAPQRGANFADILGSRSSTTPVFGSWLCEPSKPQNHGKTFRAIPTRQNLSCLESVLWNIFAGKHWCFKTWRQLSV